MDTQPKPGEAPSLRIAIADDHPLFRNALKSIVDRLGNVEVFEGSTLDDCHALLEFHDGLDLVLLDLNMEDSFGLYGLVSLRNRFPSIPVVVISAQQDASLIQKAFRLGALGYIPKSSSPATIEAALSVVLAGQLWLPEELSGHLDIEEEDTELADRVASLTPQQYRVLGYLRDGLLNKEIAGELGVSEATIKAHLSAVFKKLAVNNRTQAVVVASQFFLDDTAPVAPHES
jgi:DNA-binding NarL/FixJ family response regulator